MVHVYYKDTEGNLITEGKLESASDISEGRELSFLATSAVPKVVNCQVVNIQPGDLRDTIYRVKKIRNYVPDKIQPGHQYLDVVLEMVE